MNNVLRPALVLLSVLTVLTGVVYPAVITGVAEVMFPRQAGGSIVMRDGKPIGSSLIGQAFSNPKYFWSRPSATAPQPYNGLASGGSNQGPLSPALAAAVKARVAALHAADPGNTLPIPVDLVMSSASGLDPDISIAAANYQAARVARLRGLNVGEVQALIARHARGRLFGWLGEPRVNVLEINLALDEVHTPTARSQRG